MNEEKLQYTDDFEALEVDQRLEMIKCADVAKEVSLEMVTHMTNIFPKILKAKGFDRHPEPTPLITVVTGIMVNINILLINSLCECFEEDKKEFVKKKVLWSVSNATRETLGIDQD